MKNSWLISGRTRIQVELCVVLKLVFLILQTSPSIISFCTGPRYLTRSENLSKLMILI